MNASRFNKVVDDQISSVEDVLLKKKDEYAEDSDVLRNFRSAAHIQGTTPMRALAGMMAKHTVSIYDMARAEEAFPLEKWDKKLTDHINYLILLRALVVEEDDEDAKLGNATTD